MRPAPLWKILAIGNGLNLAVSAVALLCELTVGGGFMVVVFGGLAVLLGTALALGLVFKSPYAWGGHFAVLGCIMITVNAAALHLAEDYHALKRGVIARDLTPAQAQARGDDTAGFLFTDAVPATEMTGRARRLFHHAKTDAGWSHYRVAPVLRPGQQNGFAPVWAVCWARDRLADGSVARSTLEPCMKRWSQAGGGVRERVIYDGYRQAVNDAANLYGLRVPAAPLFIVWVPSIEAAIEEHRGYRDALFLIGIGLWNGMVLVSRGVRIMRERAAEA